MMSDHELTRAAIDLAAVTGVSVATAFDVITRAIGIAELTEAAQAVLDWWDADQQWLADHEFDQLRRAVAGSATPTPDGDGE